jgi:ribosomal peptide maturation radical SAM protein 1
MRESDEEILSTHIGAEEPRVLILQMPWATPGFPGIGSTLVRGALINEGVSCDLLYVNLVFWRLLADDSLAEQHLWRLAVSEIAFSPYYFDVSPESAAHTIWEQVIKIALDAQNHSLQRIAWIVEQAGACLREVFESTDWSRYDVVGFSVMLQQTVASLALAKLIKLHHPHIKILFGGPSTSWPMGDEMVRCFTEIDCTLEGEADHTVTPLVRWMHQGCEGVPPVPGVSYRTSSGEVRDTGRTVPPTNLDGVATPDFTPFFEQLTTNGLSHIHPQLTIETSRGCWWGQKHHCTFCGIDDLLMTYRSKSEERILTEVMTLSAENRITEFFVVDSIFNHKFLQSLMPAFERLRNEMDMDFTFFFESKSNLKWEQVRTMREAGVTGLQPGLESFSDNILKLMNKGTTGARQVLCLKLLAEGSIAADWNLIISNPGETAEDYRIMTEAIPFLHHLRPLHGTGVTPMQVNRFAPYHNDPTRYGLANVRPRETSKAIYAAEGIDFNRLSFYFEYDDPNRDEPNLVSRRQELLQAISEWRKVYRPDTLIQRRGPGFLHIEDQRRSLSQTTSVSDNVPVITILRKPWSDIFAYCDEIRTEDELARIFADRVGRNELTEFLNNLVDQRFIYRSPSGQILNLPLRIDRLRGDA